MDAGLELIGLRESWPYKILGNVRARSSRRVYFAILFKGYTCVGCDSKGRCRRSFECLLNIMIHKCIQLSEEGILHGFLDLIEALLRLKPIAFQVPFSICQPYLVVLANTEVVQEL